MFSGLESDINPHLQTVVTYFISGQGIVVLRVNIRFVILTRKGRGIEPQLFLFLYLFPSRKKRRFREEEALVYESEPQ